MWAAGRACTAANDCPGAWSLGRPPGSPGPDRGDAAGRSIDPRRRLFLSKTGKPFNSEHFYCVLRRTADAAGIDRVEPYGTRHLGTTEAIEAGASEAEAAALLGHTPNSTVVRRYSQDRTALARRAANAIGGRETG